MTTFSKKHAPPVIKECLQVNAVPQPALGSQPGGSLRGLPLFPGSNSCQSQKSFLSPLWKDHLSSAPKDLPSTSPVAPRIPYCHRTLLSWAQVIVHMPFPPGVCVPSAQRPTPPIPHRASLNLLRRKGWNMGKAHPLWDVVNNFPCPKKEFRVHVTPPRELKHIQASLSRPAGHKCYQ